MRLDLVAGLAPTTTASTLAAASAASPTLAGRLGDQARERVGEAERRGGRVRDVVVVEHDAVVLGVVDDRDAAGGEHLVRDERDVGGREHQAGDAAVVERVELLGRQQAVVGRGERKPRRRGSP